MKSSTQLLLVVKKWCCNFKINLLFWPNGVLLPFFALMSQQNMIYCELRVVCKCKKKIATQMHFWKNSQFIFKCFSQSIVNQSSNNVKKYIDSFWTHFNPKSRCTSQDQWTRTEFHIQHWILKYKHSFFVFDLQVSIPNKRPNMNIEYFIKRSHICINVFFLFSWLC